MTTLEGTADIVALFVFVFLVVIDVFDRDDEKNNDAAVATSCAPLQQQKEKGISRISG